MLKLTDVVKHLAILNVLMLVLVSTPIAEFLPDLGLYFFKDSRFQPYQIVTHMFMHADAHHLIMNMIGLIFFGPTIERFVGSKNFFILYFSCGLGAVALRSLMQFMEVASPGYAVGASGAVMGVLATFAALFPKEKIYLLFFPFPIKALYLILAYVGFELFLGFSNFNTGVAHFAHLGGIVVGFAMAWFWFKKYNFRR